MAQDQTSSFGSTVDTVIKAYYKETPAKLQILDVYLAFLLATGILQFVYVFISGGFPFNAFLAGFISCVASFVLTVGLRMQHTVVNGKAVTPGKVISDYFVCHAVLFLVIAMFMG
eukprot:Clim_evm34s22 gene=Clim_evmTU34s22